MGRIGVEHRVAGTLRIAGWLLAIGFLKVSFRRAARAIVPWPHYPGNTFSESLR